MNRDQLQSRHINAEVRKPDDEFDTNIHGPWMNRWDIVHHNRHTQTLIREKASWDTDQPGDKA